MSQHLDKSLEAVKALPPISASTLIILGFTLNEWVLAGCAIAAALHPFGLLAAVIALFTIGIGKEVYDRFTGGTVDVYDAMATVWGGAVMLGWIELARAFLQ